MALAAGRAEAHQASITYSDVAVSDDHTEVSYRLRINTRDLAEPLGLPADTVPSDAQIRAGADQLFAYVLDQIEVEAGGLECRVERGGLGLVEQTDRFVELRWQVVCPESFNSLAIEYHLFFDLDPLHTGNLKVSLGDEVAVAPIQGENRRFSWDDLGGGAPTTWWLFIRLGVEHIVFGFDHVCFLLGLLLVVVIHRPPGRSWQARGVGDSIRHTALIVTAFTVAHSITLIAAALGWVSLPSRLVESLIALSIVWIAVENVLVPEPRFRWLLTFAFGLMHGLGFASVLQNLLSGDELIVPLLSFNIGVELGQLAIVVLVVPLLHLTASRLLGARDYRRILLPIGCTAIGLLGVLWLAQRVLGL